MKARLLGDASTLNQIVDYSRKTIAFVAPPETMETKESDFQNQFPALLNNPVPCKSEVTVPSPARPNVCGKIDATRCSLKEILLVINHKRSHDRQTISSALSWGNQSRHACRIDSRIFVRRGISLSERLSRNKSRSSRNSGHSTTFMLYRRRVSLILGEEYWEITYLIISNDELHDMLHKLIA